MDRKIAKAIAADMTKALEKIGTKYGGTFKYKGGRFIVEDGTFAPKFEFAETGENGRATVIDTDWTTFKRYHPELKDVELGAYFVVNGTRYRLENCKPRSPKWPIVGAGPRGGMYKFRLEHLVEGLL